MKRAATNERGSATAEFALTLPAVVLALVMGIAALSATATQVSLQDAVADAARLLGRGESAQRANEVARASLAGIRLTSLRTDGLVCVTGEVELSIGSVLHLPLRASACALDGGG